jgi:prophage regulatory protein
MTPDIVDRLRIDPGQRTLGQILQDREAALHEILRLRQRLAPETPLERQRKDAAGHSQLSPRVADALPPRPAGTLLRRKEVTGLLGISNSSLYQRIAEGTFPAQVRIGPRAVRWRYEDVIAWRNAQRP